MTSQLAHKEGRIALALQAYRDGHFTGLREAANAYDILYSTFRYRVQEGRAKKGLRAVNAKLLVSEKKAFIKYILSIDERGLLVRSSSIKRIANLLFQKRSNIDPNNLFTVSKC